MTHQCHPPAAADQAQSWTCPVCGSVWDFHPRAGRLTEILYGRRNVRRANGSPIPPRPSRRTPHRSTRRGRAR